MAVPAEAGAGWGLNTRRRGQRCVRAPVTHSWLQPFSFWLLPVPRAARSGEGCHQIGAGGDAQNRAPGLPTWLPYLFRGGQLAFPSLATEGEHLARNRRDYCKVSCSSWGLGFRWDHWAKREGMTKGF